MSFPYTMTEGATFRQAFARNAEYSVEQHKLASDQFLRDLWAQQARFWSRLAERTTV